jgi:hypothetical protein
MPAYLPLAIPQEIRTFLRVSERQSPLAASATICPIVLAPDDR